jgi:hypothetical protein
MASKKWNPARVHRALAPEFLTPIADLLWNVQRRVSEHVQPEEGDENWVAGCTAYTRRCYWLARMAAGPDRSWLWAGKIDGQFYIRIHGFPIRVYRAPDEGEIPVNYADGSTSEMALLGKVFALPIDDVPRDLYRIEVVAKKLARPVRVALVEVNERGAVVNSYTIPRSLASAIKAAPMAHSAGIRPLRQRKPPVMLPAPDVQSTKPDEQKNNEEHSA